MNRRKPTVLLESVDSNSGKATQVLQSENLYVVVYEGKPFNLKLLNKMFDYPGPKYKKTSFCNPAHAQNLADKMNVMFGTSKFTVVPFMGDDE